MAVLFNTGFLFAFYNKNDINHDLVSLAYARILDGVFGVPYLLDYVFDKLMTLIQARIKSNKLATKIGNLLLSDMKFIYCSQKEFSNALFHRY